MVDYGAIALGGGLTLLGTLSGEVVRLLTSRADRREQRAIKSRDYRLTSLEQLQEAASGYRTALFAYNRDLDTTKEAEDAIEERLQNNRAGYQAHLYRVDEGVTRALQVWSEVAVRWTQLEGSAEEENALWERAMELCGRAIKRQLK